jgi:hypothetical protein
MKIRRILLLASAIAFLPVASAEEKHEKPRKPDVVEVTLKRIKLPDGEKLDEVTTTSAVLGGELEGTLSINVGTAEQPRYWTVEFDSDGEDFIHLSVSDPSRMLHGMKDGTSSVSPVELFRVHAPFDGSGTVTIYRTKGESLTLEVSPVTATDGKKPEAE